MQRGLAILLVIFSLAACSMPETKIYSIYLPGEPSSPHRTDAGAGKTAGPAIAILSEAPKYLSQPYIAYRTSPYQLALSKYSKWDLSPNDLVREMFRVRFDSAGIFREVRTSNYILSDFYSLIVRLKKFELYEPPEGSFGELAIEAVLLSPDGTEQYRGAVVKRVPLGDKNFLGLAKALSAALSEGIEEIKTGVAASLTK